MHMLLSLALAFPLAIAGSTRTINDSWYTMQAGSTPFGYFHEIIEQRDDRYSYRYTLTRAEGDDVYQENIGALAQLDLTPIAFNLNKAGRGATESINATYASSNEAGKFKIDISGARSSTETRLCPKNAILDVFFPLWLQKNWSKLKPGYRGWLQTFAEDPEHFEFRARTVRFEVKSPDKAKNCLGLKIEIDSVRGEWCMRENGVLIEMKVGDYHIKRVESEAKAKSFVAAFLPKPKKQ